METMANRRQTRRKNGKGKVSLVAADPVPVPVALGDLIHIRFRNGSWWPAQVVDAKRVDESMKPYKKSSKEVLVRVYGSYMYKYVDPTRCHSEFEMVLKNYNGSYQELLQEALERDIPNRKSKAKGSSSKTKGTTSPAGKRKADEMLNDDDPDNGTTPLGKSQELSARRIRVMESLGLIAPQGSPFVKDRCSYMQM